MKLSGVLNILSIDLLFGILFWLKVEIDGAEIFFPRLYARIPKQNNGCIMAYINEDSVKGIP